MCHCTCKLHCVEVAMELVAAAFICRSSKPSRPMHVLNACRPHTDEAAASKQQAPAPPARRGSASKLAAAAPAPAAAARFGRASPAIGQGMPILLDSDDDDAAVFATGRPTSPAYTGHIVQASRGPTSPVYASAKPKPKPCGAPAVRPGSARPRPRSGKENCTGGGGPSGGGNTRPAAAAGSAPPKAGAQAAAIQQERGRAAPAKPPGGKKPMKQMRLSFARKPAAAAPLAPVNQ